MLKLAAPILGIALLAYGCGQPQQQKPPRIADDFPEEESDMQEEKAGPIPVENQVEETEADKRAKCCQQCVAGVAADQSGDPPGALSCKSLQPSVEPGCILYFDDNPMNGKEAQACVAESAPSDAPPEG